MIFSNWEEYLHYTSGNIAGFFGIILWSLVPFLVTLCAGVPVFLLLGTACLVTFLMYVGIWMKRGDDIFKNLRVAPKPLAVATVGHGLYRGLVWSAVLLENPVKAGLACFLWPVSAVVFVALFTGQGMRQCYWAGFVMGTAGVVVLVSDGMSLFREMSLGYGMAMVSVLVWGIHVGLMERDERCGGNAVVLGYLVSAVLFFGVAGVLEWPWELSLRDFSFVALAALTGGVGSYLWEIGREDGDRRSLGLWSLLSPLLAVFWLVRFGGYGIDMGAAIGAVLVFGAGVAVSPDFRRKNVIRLQAGGD